MSLLTLLMSTTFMFGNDPLSYAVALPERTYSGEWDTWVEFIAAEEFEAEIKMVTYDGRGRQIEAQNFTLAPHEVFVYVLEGEKGQTVQSVWFESSSAISGMLWMYRPEFGQLNAARISPVSPDVLVFPHVPRNYLEWNSSLALSLNSELSNSDVFMSFYGEQGQNLSTELVGDSLGNFQYLRRTPNVDVLVGGLLSNQPPFWGEIRANGAQLSGYQTFSRQSETMQTSVLELSGDPRESGMFDLSLPSQPKLQAFLFTNPLSETVSVDVEMIHWEFTEDGGWIKKIDEQQLDIEPRSNQFIYVDNESSQARILKFSASSSDAPTTIYAARFVYGQNDVGMGADLPGMGFSSFRTWFNLNTPFERVVSISNITDAPLTIDGRFWFSSGTKKSIVVTLDPGETRFVGRDDILLTVPEDEQEAGVAMGWVLFQCSVRGLEDSQDLSVLTTVIGQSEKDFSLISQ